MKIPIKYFITIVFIMISLNSIAQLSNFPLMIGSTNIEIENYLDSIDKLRYNPNVKIEKKVTDQGSLMYVNDFSIVDENFYKCSEADFIFRRVSGTEICVGESIVGSDPYAEDNLGFVKDHFFPNGENKWLKWYNDVFQVAAQFYKESADAYSIEYDLIRKDTTASK